jgi:hypothetical protein
MGGETAVKGTDYEKNLKKKGHGDSPGYQFEEWIDEKMGFTDLTIIDFGFGDYASTEFAYAIKHIKL